MRFRSLATIGTLLLILAGQSAFGGQIGIGIDFNVVDVLEDNPDITDILIQVLSGDSNEFPSIFSINLLQSVLGTPFAIAPPIVELVVAAMVIIEEEEENLLVIGDVDEVLLQLRPILYSELGFIRLVCDDLTVEQRAQIRSAAEASLKLSATTRAAIQEPENAVGMGVLLETRTDPLSTLRQDLDTAMKEVLTPEKYATYAEFAANRIAHRKRAALLAMVAQLDGNLCLSFQQREKIINEISSHWQDEWEQWLEWDSDFTELPKNLDPIIRPLLDELQVAVWKQTPKSQFEEVLILKQEAETQFNDGWWGEVNQMAPDNDGEKEEFPF